MLVVDAQIHLWKNGGGPPAHRPNFTYGEAVAEMDAAGVDVAIDCPPIWDDAANDYAVEAHQAHPDRFLTHAWVDLLQPDSRERLRACKQRPGVVGLRFLTASPVLHGDSPATMNRIRWPEEELDWFWEEAEALGLPLAVCGHAILPHVEKRAQQHPGLKITLDHFGAISMNPADGLKQLPGLETLARLPNVAIKVTAAPGYASDPYPHPSVHDAIRRLYDSFGPERLFWGSDVTRLRGSWRQCLTLFTEELPWLSEADKALIVGQAFCDWHGISPRPVR